MTVVTSETKAEYNPAKSLSTLSCTDIYIADLSRLFRW